MERLSGESDGRDEIDQVLFEATSFNESDAQVSPDGRWVAYTSDESGKNRVYVRPFPGPGGKTPISIQGGEEPRWSRDGRELFYLSTDRHVLSVPVQTTPTLTFGRPVSLFVVKRAVKWDDAKTSSGWNDFDVSLDGQRFLAVVPQPANEQPLTAVVNWATGLAK